MNHLIKLTMLCGLSMFLTVSLADENAATESLETDSPDTEMQAQSGTVDEVALEEKSSVMDQPLDGTSIESFTAGLEKVDEEATEQEYRDLMSSLDFLLFYDIGARRDKAKLYSRLNGKSPAEILEKVAKIRNNKN